MKVSFVLLFFAFLLFETRTVLSAEHKPVLFVKGSGIIYLAEDNSIVLFKRDAQGKVRLIKRDFRNLSFNIQNMILDSFPSKIILDSSGKYAFSFAAYGGTFNLIDLGSGTQKVVLQRKAGLKGFWIDPPYPMVFQGTSKIIAYGYPVNEDGTGDDDGIYEIDLGKSGIKAISLIATKDNLLKAASTGNGTLKFVSPQEDSPFILYGINIGKELKLMLFDGRSKTASEIDRCAGIGQRIVAAAEKAIAYNCAQSETKASLILFDPTTKEHAEVSSGNTILLDLDPTGSRLALAQQKGKEIEVGLAMRKNQFKFLSLMQVPLQYGAGAKFIDGGKSLIIETQEGLWYYPIDPSSP